MVTPCRTEVRSFGNCICSESVTNIWCCFFLAWIHEFRNQVMKMEEVPLTVIPSDLLANFCFLFLWLCSAGLKVLVPKGWNASTRRHNNDSIELKIKTASQPLCVPHACEARKGITGSSILSTKKLDRYSMMEVRENVYGIQEIFQGISVLPCLVIKVNRKLQRPNPGQTRNGPDPSEMNKSSSYLVKNHNQLRSFLKAKGIQNGQ